MTKTDILVNRYAKVKKLCDDGVLGKSVQYFVLDHLVDYMYLLGSGEESPDPKEEALYRKYATERSELKIQLSKGESNGG